MNDKNITRRIGLLLIAILLVGTEALCQEESANSHANDCLKEYLQAFNSEDRDQMERFYLTYKSPEELETESAEERAKSIGKVIKMLGTLSPAEVKIISSYEIEQVVQSSRFNKRWFALRISMNQEHPEYYESISMMPVKSSDASAKNKRKSRHSKEDLDGSKPQTPTAPYSYKEKEVQITNPGDGTILTGTLTLPKGSGKHPLICLVTGGSPFDRDQSLGGHKPFLVWADYLTQAGFATLRFDDRGVGESGGDKMASSYDLLTSDILAAVSFAKQHKKIDATQIGLLGHSQGSCLALMAAAKSTDIKYLVLLASLGMPLLENIAYQQVDESIGTKEINVKVAHHISTIIKEKSGSKEESFDLDAEFSQVLLAFNEQDRETAQAFYDEVKQFLKMFSASNMGRDALVFHPNSYLEKNQTPVLVLTGEYDGLVINHPSMLKAIEKSGIKDYKITKIDKLNHMLQKCSGPDQGDPTVYLELEETVNPEVLRTVKQWVQDLVQVD